MRGRLVPIVIAGLAVVSLASCSYTPSAVENRTQLPSCGSYENLNEPLTTDQRRKNRCILDALAEGRRAELVRIWATEEGDPITEYFRVLGPDKVEVFHDPTSDSLADAGWSHWLCRGLEEQRGTFERVGCREIPVEEPAS
jgi:hypothetical protein